jgi:hypothetical protein
VDRDIGDASLAARIEAQAYARETMEAWMRRVRQLTEEKFIPWYAGYWTQQWLAIKMAWYEMNDEGGTDLAVERLAEYLQEQYYNRVLVPVAEEIDPEEVMGRATALYVTALRDGLEPIPERYGVPQDQFDRRLEAIPAIIVETVPRHSVSVHDIVNVERIESLPAYTSLRDHILIAGGGLGEGPSEARMGVVAERAANTFVEKIAVRGGASAAAAALGGVVGIAIGVAATAVGAVAHEKDRPGLEAQLRENLNAALAEMWQGLMEDSATGVMAPVSHICGQIQRSLGSAWIETVQFEGEAVETELFGGDLLEGDGYYGTPLNGEEHGGESIEAGRPFEAIF